jgi:hypothetical protein
MEAKIYTLKDLQKQTNAPAYVIQYLKACNRLPIAKESPGQGFPVHYKPEAVEVVKKHLEKRKV